MHLGEIEYNTQNIAHDQIKVQLLTNIHDNIKQPKSKPPILLIRIPSNPHSQHRYTQTITKRQRNKQTTQQHTPRTRGKYHTSTKKTEHESNPQTLGHAQIINHGSGDQSEDCDHCTVRSVDGPGPDVGHAEIIAQKEGRLVKNIVVKAASMAFLPI